MPGSIMGGGGQNNPIGNRQDPLTTFHFYVDGVSEAVFTEVSGLSVEVDVTSYEEGGVNSHVHRLPGRVKIGDITLRNGITTSNKLWNWYKQVLQEDFSGARRNVSIVVVDQQGQEVERWSFIRALPVKWTGPQLQAGQSAAAVQTLQITHEGLQIT